ncbi:MAG TPA: PAS domain-containing protein [Erysipelothrix sp.]|nr:PAS domain-containing protein [Erysipelothrix sp.]
MINNDAVIIKAVLLVTIFLIILIGIVLIFLTRIKNLKERLNKHKEDLAVIKKENVIIQTQNVQTQSINSKRFNYLNAIFTSIQDGILLLDNNRNIILMNPQAQRILGADDNVFFDKTRIHHSKLYLKIDDLIQKTIDVDQPITNIIDVQEKYFELFMAKIYDKYSELSQLGILISIRDVTNQFKIEKLRQDFVQNVSHEFRTPLTIVSSYIETLKMWSDISENYREEAFRIIDFELNRLQKILNQLLDITNLEHNKVMEEISVSKMIKEILPSYRRIAMNRNIKIEVLESLDENVLILANRLLFLQAFSNLLENAIKYTYPDTRIFIELSATKSEVFVAIKDQGPGLPDEDQASIFERFYRVDEHRNSQTGGSGLGLSFAKDVIESFDGKIWVKSKLMEGSTFTIAMPKHIEKRN